MGDGGAGGDGLADAVDELGGQAAAGQVMADPGGVGGGEDGAQDGHAEGPAHLTGGVVDGRTHTGFLFGKRSHDGLGGGGHGQGHTGGHDQHGDEDGGVAAVNSAVAGDEHAGGDDHQSAGDDQLGAQAPHQRG